MYAVLRTEPWERMFAPSSASPSTPRPDSRELHQLRPSVNRDG